MQKILNFEYVFEYKFYDKKQNEINFKMKKFY